MSMVLGAITILGIALALFFLYRKIFAKDKDTNVTEDMASKEVLGKEVSHFDTKTGDEKGTGKEGVQKEESDNNKEIK